METSVIRRFAASCKAGGELIWKINDARALQQRTDPMHSESLAVNDFGFGLSPLKWNLYIKPDSSYEVEKRGDPKYIGIFVRLSGGANDCGTKVPATCEIQAFLPKTASWVTVAGPWKKNFETKEAASIGHYETLSHKDLFAKHSPYLSTDGVFIVKLILEFEIARNHPATRHAAAYFHRMANMYASREFSDYELVSSDGMRFPVNKFILAAHSSEFRAILKRQSKRACRAVIPDVDGPTLDIVLSFIYSGETAKVKDAPEEVLDAALKYDIPDLRDVAIRSVCESLTAENAYRLHEMARKLDLSALRTGVSQFIVRNWDALSRTLEFLDFKENNGIMFDIVEAACGSIKRR